VDKVLIFAVLKQWLLQQRETEAGFVYIISFSDELMRQWAEVRGLTGAVTCHAVPVSGSTVAR